MEMQNDSVVMDLSDCVLIDLNISAWTGRKLDKKVSEEIDSAKGTKSRAGNYHKHLLAGTQKLEQVQKLVGTIRTWHYEQTTVWSDGGSRLLPMANFFDYKASLDSFKQQFEDAVEDFLQEYPQLVLCLTARNIPKSKLCATSSSSVTHCAHSPRQAISASRRGKR